MTNPLKTMRKYQAGILVVVGVVCIFLFTIGDVVQQFNSRGPQMGGGPDPVVVAWRGGRLRQSEMGDLRFRYGQTSRFLNEVMEASRTNNGSPKAQPLMILDSEQWVLETILLAEKGKQMGLAVNDEAVNEYLKKLSDGNIGRPEQFDQMMGQIAPRQLTAYEIRQSIRTVMLAEQVRSMVLAGIAPGMSSSPLSPGESWDYFNRLNRRVRCELIPLDVAAFLSQVKDEPTEAQVKELYEKHKNDYDDPYSPDPGFRQRERRKFEYVVADFEKILAEEQAKVTEEQIAEYYEKNKDSFRQAELPEEEPATTTDPQPEGTDPQPEGTDPQPQPEGTDPQPQPEGTDPEPQPEGTDPEPQPEGTDPQPEPQPEGEGEGELNINLGNCAEEEEPAAEQPQPDTEAEPAVPMAVEPEAEPETPPEAEPQPEVNPQPEAEPQPETEPAEENPGTEKEPAEGEPATEPAQPKPPKYKPLEEVSAQIRQSLAQRPARERVDEMLKDAKAAVDSYFRKYKRWQADVLSDPGAPKPAYPDFSKFGDLKLVRTEFVDAVEAGDLDIGQAYQITFTNNRVNTLSFAQLAFGSNFSEYLTGRIDAPQIQKEFVYWGVEQKEAYTPSLEEAKPQVIRAWKMKRAFELAKEEAAKLVAQARDAKKPFTELFKDRAVTTTDEFSWMSGGFSMFGGGGAPYLSDVTGVEQPGNEFMRAVYSTPVGGDTVAVNQPHTMVYAAHVVSSSPSEEVLREQFMQSMASGISLPIRYLARNERQEMLMKWYQELEADLNVQWHEIPDQRS